MLNINLPNREEFTKLYIEDHIRPEDLAEIYFVSIGTIAKWIKIFKISRDGKLISQEKLQLLLNKGLQRQQIAKILGCTITTVRNYVNKYGLEVNKL